MRAVLGSLIGLLFVVALSGCDGQPLCDDRVVVVPQILELLELGDTVLAVADVEAELQSLASACGRKLQVYFVINPKLPFEGQDMISDDIAAFDAVHSVVVAIATMKQNP